ncbi:MAG TPA: hypothetical protein VIJ67_06160 [Pseudolabrys sp.]
MNESDFRTGDEEVLKLLEECGELKRTLKSINSQLGRIENRVKVAFPATAKRHQDRKSAAARQTSSSLTAAEALAEFDNIVKLASSGATIDAQDYLERRSAVDLLAIAKEVGVSFPTTRPSVKTMRQAILGKVRESVLLSRHNPRG